MPQFRSTTRYGHGALPRRRGVHFLHIGKAAGTHVARLAKVRNQGPETVHTRKHGHRCCCATRPAA